MKTLDHLEQLAKAASKLHVEFGGPSDDAATEYICACDPATILQLIALLRQMHGALEGMSYWAQPRKTDKPELCGFECKQGDMSFCDAEKALVAFDTFENGE